MKKECPPLRNPYLPFRPPNGLPLTGGNPHSKGYALGTHAARVDVRCSGRVRWRRRFACRLRSLRVFATHACRAPGLTTIARSGRRWKRTPVFDGCDRATGRTIDRSRKARSWSSGRTDMIRRATEAGCGPPPPKALRHLHLPHDTGALCDQSSTARVQNGASSSGMAPGCGEPRTCLWPLHATVPELRADPLLSREQRPSCRPAE